MVLGGTAMQVRQDNLSARDDESKLAEAIEVVARISTHCLVRRDEMSVYFADMLRQSLEDELVKLIAKTRGILAIPGSRTKQTN